MKIHSVAVLGAGAVGSYVIWGLSEKKDISLSVIAKGERAERLKAEGCLINGKTYHPEVLTPEEAKGVDLLVVSLKYGALAGALDDIREAVGENTIASSSDLSAGAKPPSSPTEVASPLSLSIAASA